jgi:hypothetical protein
MRNLLIAVMILPALWLAAPRAIGDEPRQSEDTTAEPARAADADADSANAKPDLAAAKAADKDEIRLPAGFKAKKRGKFTVYCRKTTALGTRFPTETCYDERGIRAYILDQEESQKQVDQMRRICGNMEACGGGG